jgi:hypothetical protein
MSRAFTIPIAFSVQAINEEEAAMLLCRILDEGRITGCFVESWWMPNHPETDRSDKDQPRLHWSNECREVGDAIAHHDCDAIRHACPDTFCDCGKDS